MIWVNDLGKFDHWSIFKSYANIYVVFEDSRERVVVVLNCTLRMIIFEKRMLWVRTPTLRVFTSLLKL